MYTNSHYYDLLCLLHLKFLNFSTVKFAVQQVEVTGVIEPSRVLGINGSQLAKNEKVDSLHVPAMKFIG